MSVRDANDRFLQRVADITAPAQATEPAAPGFLVGFLVGFLAAAAVVVVVIIAAS